MYISRFSDKFNSFITTILPFIGLFLILLAIGLMWYWESTGREKYLYDNVVVLNKDVNKGEAIKGELLQYKSFEKTKTIKAPVVNMNDIVNKTAKHFIPSGTQLHKNYFEDSELNLKEDELLFQIPDKWIVSIPDSIRRNDKILLVPYNKEKSHNEHAIETTVAYVKDNANREIVSVGDNERYNGTSKISNIEVIVTLDHFNKLKQLTLEDNKFIVLYKK